MLWFKRAARAPSPPAVRDEILPADLPLALDPGLFTQHFAQLLQNLETAGGVEPCLERLVQKQRRFGEALQPSGIRTLGLAGVKQLLEHVFTARRRLYPALEALGEARITALVVELLTGEGRLTARMQEFVDAMPGAAGTERAQLKEAAKLRRAAWDFAAELLHFSDPVKYPLMSRWVWDRATQSGALREFIRDRDGSPEIPFDNSPELFEGGRKWLAERVAERGIYRDVPLWIDLALAQAYATYLRSVTDGSLGADFGRGARPHEQLVKLLGMDAGAGHSRVKKAVNSER